MVMSKMLSMRFAWIPLGGVLALATNLAAHAGDWTIEPGLRVGRIRKDTSEQGLIKIYGKGNVKQSDIYVGEGFSEPGTVVFPDDPKKTLWILWKSTSTRAEPASVRVQNKGAVWKCKNGITIGTSLKEIEKLNGKPFVLSGFAWDYGGTILHSNGGRLKELGGDSSDPFAGRTLLLRLEPSPGSRTSTGYNTVLGDHAFSSENPAMQELNPVVYDMVLVFK